MLPSGFYDLSFEDSKRHYDMIRDIMLLFLNNKYKPVKPSSIDFDCGENKFRIADKFSNSDIFLRNDITPQIIRWIKKYSDRIEDCTKLCYTGDVFYLENNNLHRDRQATQVGIEILSKSFNDEFIEESLEILIKSLDIIGISRNDLQIDVTIPNCILEKNFNQRNLDKIASEDLRKIAMNLTNIDDTINIIKKNKITSEKTTNLIKNITNFTTNKLGIRTMLDLVDDGDFSYQKDFAFTIYKDGVSYPIIRGGGYELDFVQGKIYGTGGTIYINNIIKC